MEKYRVTKKLGEGTYGVVRKAINKETDEAVALKNIRLESEDEGIPCTAIREIALLKELEHPNIVKLLEIVHDIDKLTLVFEFCNQDLKKYIDDHFGIIPTAKMKSFLYQLLKGMTYCHSKRVLHRDLKPQNLLISADGSLKIADFGLARAFSVPVRNYSHEVVTLWYRAPEVLMGYQHYSTPIDMWSVGCIFAEMKNGKPLFSGKSSSDQLQKIFKSLGTVTPKVFPKVVDLPEWKNVDSDYEGKPIKELVMGLDDNGCELLSAFLHYDPSKRITAAQAQKHPYLKECHEPQNNEKQ